jgi:hypothetical protein
MKERISDAMFVKEMSILWQNLLPNQRRTLGNLIRNYFDCGTERSDKIIQRMQERIDDEVTE